MSSELRRRASLGLNVVLAVAAVVLALRRSEPAPAPSVIVGNHERSTNKSPARKPRFGGYPETASASDQRRWVVDQLRAMGVPNKVLARIVLEDLDWGWNKRGGEVSLQSHGDPDTMAELQLEFDMSKDAEMRAALGEEGFKQWDQENMLREANSGKIQLTATETEATYDLWKKMQQHELELKKARVKGEMDDADLGDAYARAASEFKEQMKSVLGDERFAKSQGMDDDSAAGNLRQDLAKASPSDSQFQELLKSQQQWNERRSEIDKQFQDNQSSGAYTEQIKTLDAARDQEYRRVLGTNVFEAYQKEQHPSYSMMRKNANIWGLDDNKIDSVYATMKYFEKTAQDYQAQARALEAQGQSVDWDGVNKNLQQFAGQTQEALQNYLGQDSFNKIQRNGVLQLSPPQSPPELSGHGSRSQ